MGPTWELENGGISANYHQKYDENQGEKEEGGKRQDLRGKNGVIWGISGG